MCPGVCAVPGTWLINYVNCVVEARDLCPSHMCTTDALASLGVWCTGAELTIAYIDVAGPKAERQKELRDGYHFECSCIRCQVSRLPRGRAAGGGGLRACRDKRGYLVLSLW